MKNATFYLLGFLLFSTTISAQSDPLDQMKEANSAYENGEYEFATKSYEALLEREYTSADLHYNYANSLFKTNRIALAILHYEKAIKINPNAEKATYNLKIANDRTVDKIEMIPELFIYRWWKFIYNLFSADSWAKIMIGFTILALIGFGIYKLNQNTAIRKLGFTLFSSGILVGLICWGLAASQKNYANKATHAVIINPTVDILSAPSSGSSQLFVLHEGTKVKIEDKTKEWLKVSLPNGNQGWIDKTALAEI
ncbi:tetratricopeptide repeat protein [Vicingaceae bacterium]|nr:tetratricopeptide repeat protein [Vicingaceae bacterium]